MSVLYKFKANYLKVSIKIICPFLLIGADNIFYFSIWNNDEFLCLK